mmetsp:Transcript_17250/g.55488  ORF Transcript_17250/g.55488 Transcript_17250/m.55488 type:complete len:359 (+) Transcript_17250:348-1424(+)
MDDTVAALVGALKERGMWSSTLFAFASDNGGPIYRPGGANNHPLKGGKYSDWEGGVRANAFLAGGALPPAAAGKAYDGLFSVADWYSTFCELAGEDPADLEAQQANTWLRARRLPQLPPVDGVSHWAALSGRSAPPRSEVHLSAQALLVARGRALYKIVTGEQPYSRWTGSVYPNCSAPAAGPGVQQPLFADLRVLGRRLSVSADPHEEAALTWQQDCGAAGCLFDVASDPSEHADLSDALPALRAELAALLTDRNRGNFAPRRGISSLRACAEGVRNGGYYGPFVDVASAYSPSPPATAAQRERDAAYLLRVAALSEPPAKRAFQAFYETLWAATRNASWRKLDSCLPQLDLPVTAT